MGVAVVCGLVASYLTSRMLAQQGTGDLPKVMVLVAKAKIPYGTQVKDPEKYFVQKEFASGSEPKKALTSFDQVKDRRINKIVGEEMFITQDDLMSKQDEAMAGIITVGMRAFSISVKSDTSVGGFVLPLMHVDIVAAIRTDKGQVAKIILQNVLVLGVDTKRDREEGTGNMVASTVTLQVKPDEVERLTAATTVGELRLMLRSDKDTDTVKTAGVKTTDLLKDGKVSNSDPGSVEPGSEESSGSSVVTRVPTVPEGPLALPGAAPEPTTRTHILTLINGKDVLKHKTTVDRATGQPVDSDVEKTGADADPPKPRTDKPEIKSEQPAPKSDKPAAEAKDGRTDSK
jgi:pilus assembly protein CpaB